MMIYGPHIGRDLSMRILVQEKRAKELRLTISSYRAYATNPDPRAWTQACIMWRLAVEVERRLHSARAILSRMGTTHAQ